MRSALHRLPTRILHRSPAIARGVEYKPSAQLSWSLNYATQSRQDTDTFRHSSTGNFSEEIYGSSRKSRGEEAFPNSTHSVDDLAKQSFTAFDLTGRVYIVTGGAGGIGLPMAEALAQAGGEVHCLDCSEIPSAEYHKAVEQLHNNPGAGMLHYKCLDVNNIQGLDEIVKAISMRKQRLDGLITAASIVQVTPVIEYKMEEAQKLMDVNFIGVLATANACAKQILRYKSRGSIYLIASMSGLIANKGLLSPVYNSSKAAMIQLARNLAMECSKVQADRVGGNRVTALSLGHVVTPMVLKTFEEVPRAKEKWEVENLMGRLGDPSEFKGVALFLLSDASSFMTGNNLVIDGGHTAW